MTARTLLRPALALGVGFLLGGAPRPAAAQLDVSADCVASGCDLLDIFLANSTAPNRPLNLVGLQVGLLNGWFFTGGDFTGEDDFSTFGPFPVVLSGGGTSAFFDFGMWIDWFALDNAGSTGFVRTGVSEGTGVLACDWSATDVTGEVYRGSCPAVGPPPPPTSTVPEPASMALLGIGLAIVAAVRRKRPRETQEG